VQPRICDSRRFAAAAVGFGRDIAPASDMPESEVYSRAPACGQPDVSTPGSAAPLPRHAWHRSGCRAGL
jgi:hypothetical protein